MIRSVLEAFSRQDGLPPTALAWQSEFAACTGRGISIVLLDGPVDETYVAPRETKSFGRASECSTHATAAALLLMGEHALLPQATFRTANVQGADGPRLASALAWARSKQPDVIVMPFGRLARNRRVELEIARCAQQHTYVVCAAGNRGDAGLLFPASAPSAISVTALDAAGGLLAGCCDLQSCEVATLGVVTHPMQPSGLFSGSSVAAVVAAGLLGLHKESLRRRHPMSVDYFGRAR